MITSNLRARGVAATLIAGFLLAAAPLAAFANTDADTTSLLADRSVPATTVSIGNGGKVLVRGATVTGVSGSTITAKSAWGQSTLVWSVLTASTTSFVGKDSQHTLASVVVGDTISFNGSLDTTVAGLVVRAKTVRDWSATGVETTTIIGTVGTISTSTQSFVLATPAHGSITVTTSASTTFQKSGSASSFSAITTGSSVVAQGNYDASTKVLTATRITLSPPRMPLDHTTSIKKFFDGVSVRVGGFFGRRS